MVQAFQAPQLLKTDRQCGEFSTMPFSESSIRKVCSSVKKKCSRGLYMLKTPTNANRLITQAHHTHHTHHTHHCRSLSFFVAHAAPTVLIAPINKQTEMAFGPSPSRRSFGTASSANSGLFPGSRILNTIMLINVPTNCGSVV
jgi:hypothetical protein